MYRFAQPVHAGDPPIADLPRIGGGCQRFIGNVTLGRYLAVAVVDQLAATANCPSPCCKGASRQAAAPCCISWRISAAARARGTTRTSSTSPRNARGSATRFVRIRSLHYPRPIPYTKGAWRIFRGNPGKPGKPPYPAKAPSAAVCCDICMSCPIFGWNGYGTSGTNGTQGI